MMRWVFWLLLAACALFFAFIRWGDGLLNGGATLQPMPPLNAGKISLLKSPPVLQPAATLPPPAALPAAVSAAAPASCMEWGEFAAADLARAAAALDALKLGDRISQHPVERDGGHWVYIPPRPTRAEVDKKIVQLKSLGVEDYFVVQEAGKWHNAISLGVFRTAEAAQKFLARMQEKGVKSAVAGERAGKLSLAVFLLKNVDAELAAKVMELQNDFPDSTLKTVACSY